jgi:hypothetical protein
MVVLLGIVSIFIIAWITIGIGWRGLVGMQTYFGITKRRPTDVSHLNSTPPNITKGIIATLESLGFHRLGEAQLLLPQKKSSPYWILVNSENFVQAETIYNRVSFSTFFNDNVLVVTDYPSGEHIETPSYQSHTITSAVNDAFNYHLQQVDKFKTKYGSPQSISNMVDYSHWEAMGRVNYGFKKMKRFFWLDIARLAIFIYGAIIIMGLPLLLRPILTQEKIEVTIMALTLPIMFVPGILSRWSIKVTNRDSRNIL